MHTQCATMTIITILFADHFNEAAIKTTTMALQVSIFSHYTNNKKNNNVFDHALMQFYHRKILCSAIYSIYFAKEWRDRYQLMRMVKLAHLHTHVENDRIKPFCCRKCNSYLKSHLSFLFMKDEECHRVKSLQCNRVSDIGKICVWN